MAYLPLPQRLLAALDRDPNAPVQLYKSGTEWLPVSAEEFIERIAALARGLAELGIQQGNRVALFAPNRPEWHVVDFALMGLGAVTVPIYSRESADRIAYIANDAGARVVFALGEAQARRMASIRGRLASVEHFVFAEAPADLPGDFRRYEALVAARKPGDVAEYRRRVAQVSSDQLATVIYTSGTTGEPKGVMLTHTNLSSNVTDSFHEHRRYGPGDIALSFLPLAHVYERMMDYGYFFRGITVAYLEHMDHVREAMMEVRPTVMAAVPRFFEKFYANIMERGHRTGGWRRAVFDWAIRVARESVPWRAYGKPVSPRVKLQWYLADALVYRKFRAGLGGRIRSFSAGGAPLARELAEFCWSVGVEVYQGYGLTESSPVISSNTPSARKVGTVGRPIDNVEVRIADDGEILVRGPCVMQGYFQKPKETREALEPGGWLHTGDIGYLDEEGFLVVTDRKKDLIKTSAGKFVAPQPIENQLKTSPFILNAAVVGDGRRFVVALIVPHFASLEAKALEIGLKLSSKTEMVVHPWVRHTIEGEVTRLTANLAQYERIKRFALLDHDFTFDEGQLTFTLKLRRRFIEQRYKDILDGLYADAEEPRPVIQ
jgi:long-chain acyl-CoA synthetase